MGVTDILKDLKTKNKFMNDLTFADYYTRLSNLAQTLFTWENVPKGINTRYLERKLFEIGQVAIYNDPTMGLICLSVANSGQINMYEEPTGYRPTNVGYNYNGIIPADDCIIIRNNALSIPTDQTIILFSERLTQIERVMDVNASAQKTPVIVLCDEKQKTTLSNMYLQYNGNMPFIFGDKSFSNNIDGVKVLNTNAPYLIDKLMLQKHELWNDCLTFLGINNSNTDKKERLIVSEVQSNDQHIDLSGAVMLKYRQIACDLINKKYGTNIKVDYNEAVKRAKEASGNVFTTINDTMSANNGD